MKNVLIISASPRKGGNSDTLCDEFMRGAVESGNTAEKIFLRDKQINYCTGCGVCNSTHKCVQKDDMAEVIEKMLKADVIVMSTPVYFYSMDAQLKTLIDRTVPRYTEMRGKDFYYIVTAADKVCLCLKRLLTLSEAFPLTVSRAQRKRASSTQAAYGRKARYRAQNI